MDLKPVLKQTLPGNLQGQTNSQSYCHRNKTNKQKHNEIKEEKLGNSSQC